jgi:hypothetical protein
MKISLSEGYAIAQFSPGHQMIYPISCLVDSDGWIKNNSLSIQERDNINSKVIQSLAHLTTEVSFLLLFLLWLLLLLLLFIMLF